MRIAILGFGTEGRSAYEYYKRQGADITICDSKTDLEVPVGAQAQLGPSYLTNLESFDLVVRSPGVKPSEIKGARIVTSVTKEFMMQCSAPIIGVTGTKGKGTTSTLITEMLKAAGKTVWLGGNIGRPALDFLEDVKATDYVVLELSSFQLMDVTRSPHIGVILMIAPEHLNWHPDMAEYVAAKGNLVRFQTVNDMVIYNAKNQYATDLAQLSVGQKVPYLEASGASVQDGRIQMAGQEICSVDQVRLLGAHNLENVCAAVAAAWQIVPNPEPLRQAITQFTGLPHRLELAGEVGGVRYYDDSFATTPETAMAAIAAFTEPKVLILGGSDKGADFTGLARVIAGSNVAKTILIGQMAPRLKEALGNAGYEDYEMGFENMADIVATAAKAAREGGVVLLSPACASFGMFKDYKDRGDQFKAAVAKLGS